MDLRKSSIWSSVLFTTSRKSYERKVQRISQKFVVIINCWITNARLLRWKLERRAVASSSVQGRVVPSVKFTRYSRIPRRFATTESWSVLVVLVERLSLCRTTFLCYAWNEAVRWTTLKRPYFLAIASPSCISSIRLPSSYFQEIFSLRPIFSSHYFRIPPVFH